MRPKLTVHERLSRDSQDSLDGGRLSKNQGETDSFCIKSQSAQWCQVTYALAASFVDFALATTHSMARNTSPCTD